MSKTINTVAGLSLVAASSLLAGCSGMPVLSGSDDGGLGVGLSLGGTPAHVIVAEAPAQVYVRLARQIYACWLSAEPALLPGQLFYAEAEPGDTGNARISLHSPGADGRKGVRTYSIAMQRVSEGTRIETEPFKIEDAAQRDSMHRAIMAWARGAADCDAGKAPEPVVTASIPETATDTVSEKASAGSVTGEVVAGLPPLPARRPKAQRSVASVGPESVAPADAKAKPARATKAKPAVVKTKPAAENAQEVVAANAGQLDETVAAREATRTEGEQTAPRMPRVISLRGTQEPEVPMASSPDSAASASTVRIHTPPALPMAPSIMMPQSLNGPAPSQPEAPEPEQKSGGLDKLPAEHMFTQSEPGFARH